jgi:hypothetical protein
MSGMIIFITAPLIFLLFIIYLQIGTSYKIYARKQDQSKRNRIVTGAGIVFALAWLIFFALNEFVSPLFTVALLGASLMGFVDDKWEVPLLLQLIFHLIFFTLIFAELNLLKNIPAENLIGSLFFGLFLLLIVGKHDGVNGLLTISTILFFATTSFFFPITRNIDVTNPFLYIVFALLSFSWFNMREKTELFMGAAGRIAIAYLILFFTLHLLFGLDFQSMLNEEGASKIAAVFQPKFLLFFAVMGIDFLQAVVRNVISKQNMNEMPFMYTYLKEKNLSVSAIVFIYAILQGVVNLIVVLSANNI